MDNTFDGNQEDLLKPGSRDEPDYSRGTGGKPPAPPAPWHSSVRERGEARRIELLAEMGPCPHRR